MKTSVSRLVSYSFLSLFACSSCSTGGTYNGDVTAVLQLLPADQTDLVGCGVGLTSHDGKHDLHFRLRLTPVSVGDIAMVEVERDGSHKGRWQSSGTSFYPLGVAKAGTATALDTRQGLRAADYDQDGLDLFACDDGATTAADNFLATLTLSGGQVHKSGVVGSGR